MRFMNIEDYLVKWNNLHSALIAFGIKGDSRNKAFISFLETNIIEASQEYYTTGEILLPDSVYDKMERDLSILYPQSELLQKIGTKK